MPTHRPHAPKTLPPEAPSSSRALGRSRGWRGRPCTGALGANPISEITNETGTWTLRFVVLTLAITPLRRLTGWNVLVRYRRMLGLFAFFYGTLHFLTYIWLDQFFDPASIVEGRDRSGPSSRSASPRSC